MGSQNIEHLGPKGMRMKSGEGSTMRNFIVCTVHTIVKLIKYSRLRWVGNVGMEKSKNAFKLLKGKPTGNRPQEGLGLDGRTILDWILKKYASVQGIKFIELRLGIMESRFKNGIEPPGSISHGLYISKDDIEFTRQRDCEKS